MKKAERFCAYCGAEFAQKEGWPRTCAGCGSVTYKNPLPVAVVLLPVADKNGLLVIRRAVRNDPGWGQFALPGGFMDVNDESWQHAAAREVFEETGIRLRPEGFGVFDVKSAPDRTLLLFALAEPVRSSDLPAFAATGETSESAVIAEPRELAFPLHTAAVRDYFTRGAGESAGAGAGKQ